LNAHVGEQVVRFSSGENPIFAVIHTPEHPRPGRRVGIVVVNSRVEYRLGPHRVFVEAARAWCNAGYFVLRMDFPGMGDSPGDQRYPHMDSFPIEPPLEARRYLEREHGVEDVVLLGNCMGARTALFAARECPEVTHLLLLGMPFSNATPFYAQDVEREGTRVSATTARSTLLGYVKRLLSPASWRRLLTGQSEYRVVLRAIAAGLGLGRGRVFHEPIYRSLRAFFERGGHALFLFGSNDIFLPDFRDEFERVKPRLPGVAAGAQLSLVDGANHTLSRMIWKAEATRRITAWLDREFPTDGDAAEPVS
jgi:pimeloyl-ACP methyl ester carboxylesterase